MKKNSFVDPIALAVVTVLNSLYGKESAVSEIMQTEDAAGNVTISVKLEAPLPVKSLNLIIGASDTAAMGGMLQTPEEASALNADEGYTDTPGFVPSDAKLQVTPGVDAEL